jgi:6,7-dimethyl-8-ribityllumazine synthase
MLKEIKIHNVIASKLPIAVVAAKYNGRYVQGLLDGVEETLNRVGMEEDEIVTIRVPGAFEIPVMAAKLAKSHTRNFGAIICLGVVVEGQTEHARLITEAVTYELARLQTDYGVPIVHEVLLVQNEEQARARCLEARHNRGNEAAQTALEMAELIQEFDKRYA